MPMQIEGSAPVTVGLGQTFYERLHDVHRVSANASQTAPARFLVFIIRHKSKPASRPGSPKETR
jgi:hypothetical protein